MSRKKLFSIIMTAVLSISMSLGILCGTGNVVRALDISYIMYVLTKTGQPQELNMSDPIPDNFVIVIGHAAPGYGNKFSYDATTDSLVMDNVFVTHDTQDENGNGNDVDANYNGVFDQNMIRIGNVKGVYGKGTCTIDAIWISIDDVQSSTLTINLDPGATLELFNVQKNFTAVDANVFTLGEGVEMTTVNAEEGTFKFTRKAGAPDNTEQKAESGETYLVVSNEKEEVTYEAAAPDSKGTVTIPDDVDISGKKYKVTKIKDGAFKNNKDVKEVNIGNNVEEIGANCFDGSGLTKVNIGSNVKKIGNGAFSNCKGLKNASLPESLTQLGAKAFYGDSKLVKLTVNCKNLKSIGNGAIKKINPKAKIVLKGTKKQKAAVAKKITKSKTGYKKTMKVKK